MSVEIVEGWTGPLDFILEADGGPIDLDQVTVTLLLKGNDAVGVDTAGHITNLNATARGKVRYLPGAADLAIVKSPYKARFKMVDGAGLVTFAPSGAARDEWKVVAP